MIIAEKFTKGQFTYTGADGANHTVPIDFNPATLDYTVTINAQGEGGQTQQAAGVASAKLNMELLFDTTDTGDDVRTKTNKVEVMLRPQAGTGGANAPQQAPPMVTFEWGAFKFVGVVDSFRQAMDFFAPNGIPLRATVTLSMSQPNYQFDQQGARDEENEPLRADVGGPLVLPGGNPSQLAADAGDPSGARGIAAANGLESLRASAGGAVAVGGGVSIGAPATFAAGASAGAGISLGLGGGGAAAGFNLSIGAGSGGVSANFGGTASAGLAASAGAFGGLHATSGGPGGKYLSTQRLLATTSAPGIAAGAQFDVTGKAVARSAGSFKADVGTARRLRFDET